MNFALIVQSAFNQEVYMHKKLLLSVFSLIFCCSCSVFMAATGSDPVDFTTIQIGAHRSDVENVLGKPIAFYRKGGSDFAIYRILTNDQADYRRAAANAVIVGLTLGLGELVTFPTEALQGDQNRFEIFYNTSGKVLSYIHIVNEAPMPNPSEVIERKFEDLQKQT